MLPALIATDVDGTLLDEDERVTARTRNVVRAAVAAGTHFVLATGRPPRWIPPVVEALGFAPMAVCANGAVIYDAERDRIVSARTLSVDVLGELAEIATRVIPGVGLAVERVGRSAHDSATPQFVSSPGYEHAWLNPDNTEVSMEDLLSAPAVKLLIRKVGARSSDMAEVLAKHIGVEGDITYSTNNGLIEVNPIGTSKATGVEEIARPLEITAEDVVAFGDMPNDVPMLRWAGHGVAMGNAHPEAMAAANEVTAPNTDDGLARVLERWWL
ncbi:HAD family hydrolase [Candidatus Mycolicibacterium alkanivorans]|uniref:HAD family hydrolase n=1 Tax=Candidatus Mycolicibacterium alkanivorans TaxID=2954114 RepID=A0ABS9YTU1_9MYCO|nr:HAD family hydrolase [Candidatus Mycolicibacterium alkanivorans]MCI4674239.1 HAD family hydrolase [Candidatus Mycolicibacterium alkanivorans]